MNKEKKMFFRFYGVTREQIDQCFEEMNLKEVVKKEFRPLTTSCNFLVPNTENTEVLVTFASTEALKRVSEDPSSRAIYMKYAAPSQPGEFMLRKPGDIAYKL